VAAEIDAPKIKEQFEALFVDAFSGESGDVIVELRLPRETLAVGAKLPIALTRRVPCETCKGTGREEGAPPCAQCHGKGSISHEVTEGGETSSYVTTCGTCDGRGHAAEHMCKACDRGYTKVEASAEVDIPAGSGPGMQIRVPGQGHIRPDKPQGDLVVVLGAGLQPETSAAAAKLPSFVAFAIVTMIVIALALMMGRQ
jgi:DnaJ-class molecular chaperone